MNEISEEVLWQKIEIVNMDQELIETHIVPNDSFGMSHRVAKTLCWCEPEIILELDDGSIVVSHRMRH